MSLYHWLERPRMEHRHSFSIEPEMDFSTKNSFFIDILCRLLMSRPKKIENAQFVHGKNFEVVHPLKRHRYKINVNLWRFLRRDLQFKNFCWHSHRWMKSRIEDCSNWAHIVSFSWTRSRYWDPKYAHCSLRNSPSLMRISTLSAQLGFG